MIRQPALGHLRYDVDDVPCALFPHSPARSAPPPEPRPGGGVHPRFFAAGEDAERLLESADVTVAASIEIAGQRLDLPFVGPRDFGIRGILLYGWLVVLVGGVVFTGVVFASGRLLMRGRQRALLAAAKL